ncbi:MAG TPA: SprB repeat-containing protein, partial [Bacteroidia bacterium]|nr:SprB repeat-containing protein [Bacteroidia bacterium]
VNSPSAYIPYTYPISGESAVGNPGTGYVITYNGLNPTSQCWPLLDDKYSAFTPYYEININLTPNCSTPSSGKFHFKGGYMEGIQQTNPSYQDHVSFDFDNPLLVTHVAPTLTITPPAGTVNAYTNTVTFDFSVNNSSGVTANDPWISIQNSLVNSLDLLHAAVYLEPGNHLLTTATYTDANLNTALFVNLGQDIGILTSPNSFQLELVANVLSAGCIAPGNSPQLDYINVVYGNECSGMMPGNVQAPDPNCQESPTATFDFKRYPSNLELDPAAINPYPTNPVDLCNGTLVYNLVINSSDIGTISSPYFNMNLPVGIKLSNIQFTYPCGGNSKSFTFGDGLGNPNTGNLSWNLNTDLASIGLTDLPGTISSPNNEICVQITLQTSCTYNPLAPNAAVMFTTTGTSNCSTPLSSTLQNTPPINGVLPPDNLSLTETISNDISCMNANGLVTITINNLGSNTVNTNTVTVNIPASLTVGPLTASYGTATGANTITWTMPPTMHPGVQTLTFNVKLAIVPSCPGVETISSILGYTEIINCVSGSCTESSTFPPVSLTFNACCENNCDMSAGASVIKEVKCNGQSTGSATVSNNGTAPFTYLWTPSGQTNQMATGLSAGCYTVTVTDANQCTATATVCITQPPALTVSIVPIENTNIPCNGGSVSVVAQIISVGTPGYSYSWAPSGQTTANAILTAGTYTVTVTDANGCTATASVSFTQPPALTESISISNVLCNGNATGSATVIVGGGTPPYVYTWSNGETTSTATGLSAGTYTVTVKDANGCTITATAVITQPRPLNAIIISDSNARCDSGSGTATAIGAGGVGPYKYSWNTHPVQTNQTATGLSAGTYTVTVTDHNGCTATTSVTINQPALLTATATVISNSCNGAPDGKITVIPSGGTPGYNYHWVPSGGTNATASNLSVGTYTVTVTDANGCTATA